MNFTLTSIDNYERIVKNMFFLLSTHQRILTYRPDNVDLNIFVFDRNNVNTGNCLTLVSEPESQCRTLHKFKN